MRVSHLPSRSCSSTTTSSASAQISTSLAILRLAPGTVLRTPIVPLQLFLRGHGEVLVCAIQNIFIPCRVCILASIMCVVTIDNCFPSTIARMRCVTKGTFKIDLYDTFDSNMLHHAQTQAASPWSLALGCPPLDCRTWRRARGARVPCRSWLTVADVTGEGADLRRRQTCQRFDSNSWPH